MPLERDVKSTEKPADLTFRTAWLVPWGIFWGHLYETVSDQKLTIHLFRYLQQAKEIPLEFVKLQGKADMLVSLLKLIPS